MNEQAASPEAAGCRPLPYHEAMVTYLRTEEADLWEWFAAAENRQEQNTAVRLDLLKSAYRLERGTQPELYAALDAASAALGASVPSTLYQLQNSLGLNAALAYLPGEAHIVLQGPVQATLNALELRAVLGHELAHFLFYECAGRQYQTAAQILNAMAADRAAEPAHAESARLYRLYTEIYCDTAALQVCGELNAAISAEVKMETGLTEVSAESYLRQAAEIFSLSQPRTEGVSHPESYMRARALQLWQQQGAAAWPEVARMLEGRAALETLDLLGQQRLERLTRRLIGQLLAPAWFQTDPVLAHARLFFADFAPPAPGPADPALAAEAQALGRSLQEYLCFVMLDFVTADRSLEDMPLAAALECSRALGLEAVFCPLAVKELGLKKKAFEKLAATAAKMLHDNA